MPLDTLAAGRALTYSHNVGRRATAGTGFNWPVAMAVGKDGVLFVANRTPCISKVTVNQEFIHEFGRNGEFVFLSGLALDREQNVYAPDEWQNRITVFDNDGNLLRTWGEEGDGPGQMNGATGLTFDADDNIWVVNGLNSRIQKFTKDGEYISGFGVKGEGPGELDMPWGITIDNNGDVYIADWNNHRVQKFNPDGAHLLTFGSGRTTGVATDGTTPYAHALVQDIGVNPNDLNHPADVAVDADGDVYVVDWMNERVVIFDAEANTLAALRGDAHDISKWAAMSLEASPGMRMRHRQAKNPDVKRYFRMPSYCAFDQENNRLLVCDTMRHRIQIYQKEEGYQDPQFNL